MGVTDAVTKAYIRENEVFADAFNYFMYDAIQYSQQVNTVVAQHRKKKDYQRQGISNGEFLSGFYKEDKLIPVITLVIFFNAGEWDGPRSLHEMMDISDPEVKKWVVDYPNLLD